MEVAARRWRERRGISPLIGTKVRCGLDLAHFREQRLRVRMIGRGVKLGRESRLDDTPQIHDDDAIADVLDHAQVVADEKIRRFNADFKSMNRFSTCAWIDTSSAATDSSQTRNSGATASARAMPMRARWPPEN